MLERYTLCVFLLPCIRKELPGAGFMYMYRYYDKQNKMTYE